jgi:ribosomal protein L37AE/L43A
MEFCSNCGSKDLEKISDNEFYCKECDITYKVEKGKVKPQPKGKLEDFDERLKKVERVVDKQSRDLYGESALPFIE